MHNCHFGQRICHHQGNQRTKKIRNNNAGSRKLNAHAATEKQPDTDSATHCDHGELALGKSTMQPLIREIG